MHSNICIHVLSIGFIFSITCIHFSTSSRDKKPPLNEEGADITYVVPKTKYFKSICKTVAFNHTISKKGCESIVLQNNYCMGQCNSLYVPTGEEEPLRVCANCIPSNYDFIRVVLSCPDRKKKFRQKTMLVIHSCQCKGGSEC